MKSASFFYANNISFCFNAANSEQNQEMITVQASYECCSGIIWIKRNVKSTVTSTVMNAALTLVKTLTEAATLPEYIYTCNLFVTCKV